MKRERNMRSIKSIRGLWLWILVIAILLLVVTPVFAIETGGKIKSDKNDSSKEEVVYITADEAGDVNVINVVNIFEGGDITDYGSYSEVKMLSTDDEINQKGDKVTFSTEEKRVYYQGTLKNNEMPWNVSIRYFMDGKEYTGQEVAGKSGKLEIRFEITKNENIARGFYDEYALQAAFALDTDICDNIIASDATVANVGRDKQLTYTILPGEGIATSIFADVTDFEMDAVNINAIKLNLNMDIDTDQIKEKFSELAQATKTLDENMSLLAAKTSEFNDGISEVKDATKSLTNSVSYQYYKDTLSAKGLDIDMLRQGNTQAIEMCTSQINVLNQTIQLLEAQGGSQSQIAQLKEQVASFTNIKMLLSGNNALIDGTKTYMDSVYSGAKNVDAAMSKIKDGGASLQRGIDKLNDGTAELDSQVTESKSKIDEQIAKIERILGASDTKARSFVSDKNTNIKSLQFVIKTTAIGK